VRLFKQKSAPPKIVLHEFVIRLDELIAAGRAGGIDVRDIANTLDGRSDALRMAFAVHAPSDAAF
jgi:hypothetical protein